MTATNHALTGAVIALAVKKPELAIPLAFLSHFATDIIPHYNPPGIKAQKFTDFDNTWSKKLSHRSFKIIFTTDMFLLLLVLIIVPHANPTDVSPWTIFFSSLAAISPDFIGGRFLIYRFLKIMPENPAKTSRFTKFHLWLQRFESPQGIYVELVWFLLMLFLIHNLSS
jgi:hypothetical protein